MSKLKGKPISRKTQELCVKEIGSTLSRLTRAADSCRKAQLAFARYPSKPTERKYETAVDRCHDAMENFQVAILTLSRSAKTLERQYDELDNAFWDGQYKDMLNILSGMKVSYKNLVNFFSAVA